MASNQQIEKKLNLQEGGRNAPYMRGESLKVSFVTIVFDEELKLLSLQARSICKFIDIDFVDKVIIVVNGCNQLTLVEKIKNEVLPEYGHAGRLVFLVMENDLGSKIISDGWHSQQALKLAISKYITTDYYIVLDAKNHFIKPVNRNRFFSEDGRAWYEKDDRPMQEHFLNAMELFGNVANLNSEPIFPTTTPAVLLTQAVRNMQEALKTRGIGSFAELLLPSSKPCTEFLAYYSYILSRQSINNLYICGNSCKSTLWRCDVENQNVFTLKLFKARTDSVFSFGVHKLARQAMSENQKQMISDLWRSAGLVEELEEALYFLENEKSSS